MTSLLMNTFGMSGTASQASSALMNPTNLDDFRKKQSALAFKKPSKKQSFMKPPLSIPQGKPGMNSIGNVGMLNELFKLTKRFSTVTVGTSAMRRLNNFLQQNSVPNNNKRTALDVADSSPSLHGVVIDIRSGSVKVGYGGQQTPMAVLPTEISDCGISGVSRRKIMDRGVVQDWDDMEHLYERIYGILGCDYEDQPVLLTEAAGTPRKQREQMAEMMFELYGAPQLCVAQQGLLDVFASGQTTGVALDVGENATQVTAVVDGAPIQHSYQRTEFGGSDITEHLRRVIALNTNTDLGPATANTIKEQICFLNGSQAKFTPAGQTMRRYALPDGTSVLMPEEALLCPEVLFDSQIIQRANNTPLHNLVSEAVAQCVTDIQPSLAGHIVVGGGSTMFPNFVDRMETELSATMGQQLARSVKVTRPEQQQHASWSGGSWMASTEHLGNIWIDKDMFDEHGARIFDYQIYC
eukprot:gb/GECH01006088.1/.p1 GENE.gb/GECH01006088.1/~~gb/GECH01006088.1/.p1  ORF type:complete len:467 (+),score=123.79 gb/GECH01006088.1/:1-1401(+)